VFGSPEDGAGEDYDTFVEHVRQRSVTAFAEVRRNLQRSAERNIRHYDLGLKPKQFAVGQWVLYFNPRKLRGKQVDSPVRRAVFITAIPSPLTAKIQRTAKMKAKTVHIDKLKAYSGTPPVVDAFRDQR